MTPALWMLVGVCIAVSLSLTTISATGVTRLNADQHGSAVKVPAVSEGQGLGSAVPPAAGQRSRMVASEYKPARGPFTVNVHNLELYDSQRNKTVPIRVYLPGTSDEAKRNAVRYPLVVFSHGAGGSREVASELLSAWCSHGYVVVAPTHADSLALMRAAGQKPDIGRAIASLGMPGNRAERVADCSLILDSIQSIEALFGNQQQGIDAECVALAGHSAGAMTTMLATGVLARFNSGLRDSRFDAAIVLSGQGVGRGGLFTTESWLDWQLPALVVTGSLDSASRMGITAEDRREPFELAPASGNKYLLWLDGATHMSFTGEMGGDAAGRLIERIVGEYLDPGGNVAERAREYDQAAIFAATRSATLAFLDLTLKSDPVARSFLDSQVEAKQSMGIEWQRK